MKSYREKYFEDYKAVKKPSNNKKGFKIVYEYIGQFKKWEYGDKPLRVFKWLVAILEVLAISSFLSVCFRNTNINSLKLMSGFGTISLLGWLFEITGIIRILVSREYIKEIDETEIRTSMKIGPLSRAAFLTIGTVISTIILIVQKKIIGTDQSVIAMYLVSGAMSLLIYAEFNKLKVISYRNENGKPGKRY